MTTVGLSASATPSWLSVRVEFAGRLSGYLTAGIGSTEKLSPPSHPALLVW